MRGDYGKPKGWTGPVTRLDDLSDAEREEVGAPPRGVRPQSDVGIKRCSSWPCKLWIASDATRCPHCHERQGV
jgi:hypothetical protein